MPHVVIDSTTLAEVVALATRAPSVHNSQPWRWVAQDGELRLFYDSGRVPRATDLSGREGVISCGAMLDHVRAAAAAAGWHATTAAFPNPNNLDHLATLSFTRVQFVTDAEKSRAETIVHRYTDRLPFTAPPSWPPFEAVLRTVVDPDKAVLTVLPDAVRPQLAEASRLTEALRRYDAHYQAELVWWTADSEPDEGIPSDALPSVDERGRVDVAREFPVHGHAERRPGVDRDRSVIVALSTHGDTRREALGCGEMLSVVLLEATMAGLATCTLTHLTELPASRDTIRELIGGQSDPQVLIRIGGLPDIDEQRPRTPRRPLAEVLEILD